MYILTLHDEKRIREIVRFSRRKVRLTENTYPEDKTPVFSAAGNFAFAYWIDNEFFIIGKNKLKLYKTLNGRSLKSQSIFVGETVLKNDAEAYGELAEILQNYKKEG